MTLSVGFAGMTHLGLVYSSATASKNLNVVRKQIKRYMNNLPPARQLFIMNYKNHAGNTSGDNQSEDN